MKGKRMRRLLAMISALALLVSGALAQETAVPNVTELMRQYTSLDLTPYLGKTVYLNFFTEWCYYCMQEMPDIKRMYDAYDENELQIVLVHVWDGEDESSTENVKAAYGMEDMTFFEDQDFAAASLVGLQGYPASLFLKPDGTIALGANYMLTWEQMSAQLDEMGVSRKADEK